MKKILIIGLIALFNINTVFAEVLSTSLTLAHDVDKIASLNLQISGDLFKKLKKNGNVLGFQLKDKNDVTIYSEDVFLRADFILLDSIKDIYLANISLFDESRLDNDDIVSFFTKIKEMKMVFFEYSQGTPVQSGHLGFDSICDSGKVVNLSGADKCNISKEQVTNLAIESGVCEENAELKDLAPVVCGAEPIKADLESKYICKFECN